MGQAKQRGTYKQRREAAIERIAKEQAKQQKDRQCQKLLRHGENYNTGSGAMTALLLGASMAALHSPMLCEPLTHKPKHRR